jgi:hypothetical protein
VVHCSYPLSIGPAGSAFTGNCVGFADSVVTGSVFIFSIDLRPKMMKRSEKKQRSGQIESLVLPVVLLLTGLILIGGDRAGILSLDRIQNLWPVALILVGLSDFLAHSDDDPVVPVASAPARRGERRA